MKQVNHFLESKKFKKAKHKFYIFAFAYIFILVAIHNFRGFYDN